MPRGYMLIVEPTQQVQQKQRSFLKVWKILEKTTPTFANLAVIVASIGVVFAYNSLTQTNEMMRQANELDKRRTAIETSRQAISPEFIGSLTRLKSLQQSDSQDYLHEKDAGAKILVDDLNYVTNLGSHIATLYNNEVADRCIIINTWYHMLQEISNVCSEKIYYKGKEYECHAENKEDIKAVLQRMRQETCSAKLTNRS